MVENPLKNFVVNWCQFSKPQMLLLWIITPTWIFFSSVWFTQVLPPTYIDKFPLAKKELLFRKYYHPIHLYLIFERKIEFETFFQKSSWTNLIFSLFQTRFLQATQAVKIKLELDKISSLFSNHFFSSL